MLRIFLIILICLSAKSIAQTVSGIVTDEDQNPLPAVVVINIQTDKKVSTTMNGEFSIEASPNQELRFVRAGFERKSKTITQLNPSVIMNVSLINEYMRPKLLVLQLLFILSEFFVFEPCQNSREE